MEVETSLAHNFSNEVSFVIVVVRTYKYNNYNNTNKFI